jgi:CheY-like chemotaxis protein
MEVRERPHSILVAEDDENDVFFLRRALKRLGLPNELIVVADGQQLVDYLSAKGIYAARSAYPLPGLLLLDLKMPRKGGFEVLAWLKSRPDLAELPVVILSSSAQESDIKKARELGADGYQVKPQNSEDLVEIVRQLHARWLA